MDLDAYLARIGYHDSREPTVDTLGALHLAHACAVPFENLDPWLNRPVSLDLAALEQKLVHERRGGYCFEHNLLFAAALEALGFSVKRLLARVRRMVPADVITSRSHLCLRVAPPDTDDVCLADVGFGGIGLATPLRFDETAPQTTPHDRRRLVPQDDRTILHQVELAPGEWEDVFRLETTPAPRIDIEMGNWFTSTHPDSLFRQHLIAARVQPDHRRTLRDHEFTRRHCNGTTERRIVQSLDELRDVLVTEFGLPADHQSLQALQMPSAAP